MLKYMLLVIGILWAGTSFAACDELVQDPFMVESETFIMTLYRNKDAYSEKEILNFAKRVSDQFNNSDSCYVSMSYYMYSRLAGLYADKYKSIEYGKKAYFTIRDAVLRRDDNVIAVNGYANVILGFYGQTAVNRFFIQMSLGIDIVQEKNRAINWMNRVVGMAQYDANLHHQLETVQFK